MGRTHQPSLKARRHRPPVPRAGGEGTRRTPLPPRAIAGFHSERPRLWGCRPALPGVEARRECASPPKALAAGASRPSSPALLPAPRAPQAHQDPTPHPGLRVEGRHSGAAFFLL